MKLPQISVLIWSTFFASISKPSPPVIIGLSSSTTSTFSLVWMSSTQYTILPTIQPLNCLFNLFALGQCT